MAQVYCRHCTLPLVSGKSRGADICPREDCFVQFADLFPAVAAETDVSDYDLIPRMEEAQEVTLRIPGDVPLAYISAFARTCGLEIRWDGDYKEARLVRESS